jgi:hypothetical protein
VLFTSALSLLVLINSSYCWKLMESISESGMIFNWLLPVSGTLRQEMATNEKNSIGKKILIKYFILITQAIV